MFRSISQNVKRCYWRNLRAITTTNNNWGKAFASSSSSSSSMSIGTTTPSVPSYGLYRLLSQNERMLLEEQKQLMEVSKELASKVEATARITKELNPILSQQNSSRHFLEGLHLEASFSVVVAGEFNAGKSTLINALLGSNLLETGALPTTDSITVIRAAGEARTEEEEEEELQEACDRETRVDSKTNTTQTQTPLGVVVHFVEGLPLLEDLTLIDTPGTNSAWMDHTERTKKMLPASDLILFVTSADRPFSDSERSLLQSIQAYRKNIILVINKMDILETIDQKTAVVDFVADKASELLGAKPVVIPVSGREALRVKLPPNHSWKDRNRNVTTACDGDRSEAWKRSNFGALESFLKDTLTSQAKVRSKLSNPIRIVEGVMAECLRVLDHQTEELKAEIMTLAFVESMFEGWKKELSADLTLSKETMTELVQQEGHRCEILLHRMKNPLEFYSWTLLDRDRFEEEWSVTQREVSTNMLRQYDKHLAANLVEHVHETADLVATRGQSQGQIVIEYISKRPSAKESQSSLVGSVANFSRFEETRKNLVEKLTKAVDNVLSVPGTSSGYQTMDKDRLLGSLKLTALISSSFHASAIGTGILMTLGSFDIDPTYGWTSLASFVTGGSITLALGKYQTEKNYREQWSRRANHLQNALEAIVNQEAEAVQRKIQDGVAPYTRFVVMERDRIEALEEECERVSAACRNLRNRIQKIR